MRTPHPFRICSDNRQNSQMTLLKHSTNRTGGWLTNDEEATISERMCWYLKVEGCGSLTDTSRCIIMGSMAGTVVSTIITSVGNGYTTEMSAHADHDQPLGVLDSVFILLGITKTRVIHGSLSLNFVSRPVADEEWLSSPFEGRVLAFGNIAKLDFDLGEGEDVSRCAH